MQFPTYEQKKYNCKEHTYPYFDASHRQHSQHQSNKNRDMLFECMTHWAIAAVLRLKNLLFYSSRPACKKLVSIWKTFTLISKASRLFRSVQFDLKCFLYTYHGDVSRVIWNYHMVDRGYIAILPLRLRVAGDDGHCYTAKEVQRTQRAG